MNKLDASTRTTDRTGPDDQLDREKTGDERAGTSRREQRELDETRTISSDVAFDVLRNARRRYVLYFLREASPRELGELAEQIAARENDTTVEALSSKQRKSVYTALYQTHLPKLADVGVVRYDRDRGVVWLADRADELDHYLDAGGDDMKWSQFYLGLSVLGGVAVFANGMGIAPLAGVPTIVLVVALISAFTVLSIVYAANRG